MSSSHQSTIMSLEQAKIKYSIMVNQYLTYFPISQIVSGKGSMCEKSESDTMHSDPLVAQRRMAGNL